MIFTFRYLYSALALGVFTPLFSAGQITVAGTSGNLSPAPLPVAAFYDTTLTIDLAGFPDETLERDVLVAVFQKLTRSVVPVLETFRGGKISATESGGSATVKITIPKFEKPVSLVAKLQIEAGSTGITIPFKALPDNLLAELAESKIYITNANQIRAAFVDRKLTTIDGNPDHLKNSINWSGIWFLQLTGDDRSNLILPDSLAENQIVVILEQTDSEYPYPMAVNRGNGWVIHFPDTWFDEFSTNAGAQLAFYKTIKKITDK